MAGRDHHHDHGMESATRITWISIAVNTVLIFLKFYGGVAGRSKALIADGIHSLSDLITDIVVLVGLYFFGQKQDESHPYGHGKIETLTAIVIGIMLFFAATKIGVDAATAIYRGELSIPHRYTIYIAALSIVLKEALYHLTVRIGRRIGSEAMIANAWHHRSDAWSSIVVMIGITLAIYVPSLQVLDSYAALLVSFFIIKVAFDILKSAINKIIDTSPSGEFRDDVTSMTCSIPEVLACHDLMARYYADRIRMEIHIEVDPQMSVLEAHRVIDMVVGRITSRHPEVEKVLVHVDPYRGVKK